MAHRITRTLTTVLALTFISVTLARAQSDAPKFVWPPTTPQSTTFRGAVAATPTQGKLFVVTIANPKHEQTCQIQSFDENQLICSRSHGRKPVVYRAADVATLILPGEHTNGLPYFLAFAGAGAGAITGAAFLASVTIVGAIPVAIVGGLLLLMSPLSAMVADNNCPDSVLYLAPGQQLHVKLRPA